MKISIVSDMWWYKSSKLVTVASWIICCCSTVKKHTHIKYIHCKNGVFQSTYFRNIVIRWLGSNENIMTTAWWIFSNSSEYHNNQQAWYFTNIIKHSPLLFLRLWLPLIPKRVIIIIIVIVEDSQLNSINITLLLVTLICLGVVSFLSLSPLLFFWIKSTWMGRIHPFL